MIDVEKNIIRLLFWASFEKSRKQRAGIHKMSQCLGPPFQLNWIGSHVPPTPSEDISL
jgi:hypothetical protein